MKFKAKLLFLALSLLCPQAFSMNHVEPISAVTMTDAHGNIFDLDDEQYETFKQLPFTKLNKPFEDGQECNFTCVENPSLTAKNIKKLLTLLQQPLEAVKALSDQESVSLFSIALYFDLPRYSQKTDENSAERKQQEVLQVLAEKCYQYLSSFDLKNLHESRLLLKQDALDVLPYYPDMNAFIADAEKKASAQGHLDWPYLFYYSLVYADNLRDHLLMRNPEYLDLSHEKLSHLGFTKKIRSLKGIENLASYTDLSRCRALSIEGHEVDDFSVAQLKNNMPHLSILNLSRNKITCLHKNQFDGMTNSFQLNVSHNPITKVDSDCFEKISSFSDMKIRAEGISYDFFRNCSFIRPQNLKGKEFATNLKKQLTKDMSLVVAIASVTIPSVVCGIKALDSQANIGIKELAFFGASAFTGALLVEISKALDTCISKIHLTVNCQDRKVSFSCNSIKPIFGATN